MPRRLLGSLSVATVLVCVLLATSAAGAVSTGVAEGKFESGTLAAWREATIYGRNEWEARPSREAEGGLAVTLPAAVGPFVATTSYVGTDTSFLWQEVQLPPASDLSLSLYLFYRSTTPMAIPSPDTLFAKDEGGEPGGNQQVRVDVLKANAPLESLSPNDILATLYASPAGGPEVLEPTLLSADLSQFAGQTVTLRIADAVSDGPMEVGDGAVSLTATPLPPPSAPAAVAEAPSTPISDGVASPAPHKLVHRLSTGAALLGVRLPAAGSLVVSDARRKAAVASAYSTRRTTAAPKPILIRTASVAVDRAQTVHVPLRPTAAAARLLAKRGRVPFRLQLTFTSVRGAVSTATYKGVLVKRLRPARR